MNYAIIVAGGKGVRMGGGVPKQFLPVGGRPVLMRTIEAFHACDAAVRLILVLPVSQQAYWQRLCDEYKFNVPFLLATGGETRFHSVKNGLALIPDGEEGIVAVHDGVRPFVAPSVIAWCFAVAREKAAVVPVVDVVETLRHLSESDNLDGESRTVSRAEYKLVQTPQTFQIQLLKRAYNQPYTPAFTDDASVVEALGERVHLVSGNRENIKLTTPFDLQIAEAILKNAGA